MRLSICILALAACTTLHTTRTESGTTQHYTWSLRVAESAEQCRRTVTARRRSDTPIHRVRLTDRRCNGTWDTATVHRATGVDRYSGPALDAWRAGHGRVMHELRAFLES